MKLQSWLAGAVALVALTFMPLAARAQSALATSEATAFLGTWTVSLDSPQGPFDQTLVLKDAGGKLAAELTSPIAPGPTPITDITKDGTDLVLKFNGDFQGTAFNAKMTLTPDGTDKAKVAFDIMDGQFVMNGTGTKAK